MAAGLGFKTFNTGDVLSAADVNGYLMQGVLVFASATARDSAITLPQEGQFAFTKDTNGLWYYDGAAWVASGAAGDIEGVTAGTGISGGGTSGTVTITNSMATAIDAKGDLVVGTGADTFSKLTVGANDTVLTADSTTATGLKWATAGGGGGTWAAWTPTLTNLTLGNGTVTARYAQSGKTVDFYVKIVLGSTSSVGTEPRVTWPVTPANTTAAQNALINYVYEDSGLSRYYGASDPITNSTTEFRFCVQNASSTYLYSTQITSSIPISWGTGDTFYAMGTYEAA
jgi:hypothetical protein